MSRQYWLVKQEPTDYSWSNFVAEEGTAWTGIRNFQARNHLRAMRQGDLVAFYHSGDEKSVVGLAQVAREHTADPTAEEGDWSCVTLKPVKPLQRPLSLAEIKSDPLLRTSALVRQSRLSVSPLTAAQFQRLLTLSHTKL